jgi:hypothetical protein
MKSLKSSLQRIKKDPPVRVPSCFQIHPGSLKELVKILNLSSPSLRSLKKRRVTNFEENNAQGVTYAYGDTWFLSSEYKIFKYQVKGNDLYRPSKVSCEKKRSLSLLIEKTDLDKKNYDHIGDIDYSNGLLFAPIRSKRGGVPHILLALTENFEVVGYAHLTHDTNDAWCAVNPWNNLLYMPIQSRADCICMYDISEFYKVYHSHQTGNSPRLWGRAISIKKLDSKFHFLKSDGITSDQSPSIQGIAFSKNGRLYIARYNGNGPWYNYLKVYNALTGQLLSTSPEYDFPDYWDEIEGISIHPSGIIYVAVAINQNIWTDRFQIYAFKYPESSFPV